VCEWGLEAKVSDIFGNLACVCQLYGLKLIQNIMVDKRVYLVHGCFLSGANRY